MSSCEDRARCRRDPSRAWTEERTPMLIPRGLLAADRSLRGSMPVAGEVDLLVVGSGVAGLSAALAAPAGASVLLATKGRLGHSATRYAQGGIAAVLYLGGPGGVMEGSGSPPGTPLSGLGA